MNVRVGDLVECIYHMSNRGKVLKILKRPVTAGNGMGSFSKMTWVVFESELDGKIYEMQAQKLRVIKE